MDSDFLEIEEDIEQHTEDSKLDTRWIEDFELEDGKYKPFYKDDLKFIKLKFIYLNKDNEIETIKKSKLKMKEKNYISRDEILGILYKYSFLEKSRYCVLSILMYINDLEPQNIKDFLLNPPQQQEEQQHKKSEINDESNRFMTVIKNFDSVSVKKCIQMFKN